MCAYQETQVNWAQLSSFFEEEMQLDQIVPLYLDPIPFRLGPTVVCIIPSYETRPFNRNHIRNKRTKASLAFKFHPGCLT